MNRTVALSFFLMFTFFQARTQEKERNIRLNGYLTSLQSVMFDSLSGPFQNENILHNRLNIKGFINRNLTFSAEFRNRLFTGDLVRLGKYYTGLTGADNGQLDMSWNLAEKQSFLLNTTVDRLWIDLHCRNFQVTAGRQRINWGQALVWNPNDIFNTYSFFDFDYPERPGSDAIRLQYFPSFTSAVEIAVKSNQKNEVTAAGLYRFNRWGYDIQFVAGYAGGEDFVAGTGWSGNLGSVSFRGEASLFQPVKNSGEKHSTALVTVGMDKILKDNSVVQVQWMYCNNPLDLNDFTTFYKGNLSAKNLAFSKFTTFGLFTWAATPLLNISVAAMWFPDLEGYFAGPSLDYSLAENLDFSLLWQHFEGIMGGQTTNINLGFLKLKYSF